MKEGFILTRYFYDALAAFEKEPTGMKDGYGNLLYNISLEQERKRLRNFTFAAQATPEVVVTSKPGHREERSLDIAEEQLASGDPAGAQKLALQVLNNRNTTEDQGRALVILARAAALSGDIRAARTYFERAAESTHDPRTLSCSPVSLGRTLDP